MKKSAAELLGTFALAFAGTGAIVINDVGNGAITHVGVALTFGLMVLSLTHTFKLNPDVRIHPTSWSSCFFSNRP